MNHRTQKLIEMAKHFMYCSFDPIHDIRHVIRVVGHTKKLAQDLKLSEKEAQALEIAAWWHDVSRSFTRKPSMIWMMFFDDMFSALLLWVYTIRFGMFGDVVGLSTRLIWCKNLATGSLFAKIFLKKRTRLLLDILKDADNLDLLHIERYENARKMSTHSLKHYYAFKTLIWLNLNTKILHMKTTAARAYIKQIIQDLLDWISQKHIYVWHINMYGKKWVENTLAHFKSVLKTIQSLDIHYTHI